MARLASAAKWQEWEERLARFERSGLPIRQFCEAEGVNPGTFCYCVLPASLRFLS